MTADGGGIPELTEAEKILLRAAEADITAMSEALNKGTATPEDVNGAFAHLMALDIDPRKRRNALRLPTDAGEHAAAIGAILRRISDGHGRYLSVDAGWYPLVIATDRQLTRLDAHYRVLQIKEKFGTLRYYSWLSIDDAGSDCSTTCTPSLTMPNAPPPASANAAERPASCTAAAASASRPCATPARSVSDTHRHSDWLRAQLSAASLSARSSRSK